MNKLMKRDGLNKKGFTLVELIVVIAILGVLMVVLVPQYIQYVEKSRIATDESAVGEVIHAAEVALANEGVYDELTTGTKITYTGATGALAYTPGTNGKVIELTKAVNAVVTPKPAKSNAYKAKTYTINITVTDGVPKVESYLVDRWA
ncbi:MAG: type II secretion system protein [Oscillospiraceae bacterium]